MRTFFACALFLTSGGAAAGLAGLTGTGGTQNRDFHGFLITFVIGGKACQSCKYVNIASFSCFLYNFRLLSFEYSRFLASSNNRGSSKRPQRDFPSALSDALLFS